MGEWVGNRVVGAMGGHAPWQDTCRQRVFRAAYRRGGTRTHDGTSRFASFASCLPLDQPSRSSLTSPPLSHSHGPRRVYCQVYAILGTNFFSHRSPEHFSNFHTSLFTMFQVMSGGASVYRACVRAYSCASVLRVLSSVARTSACASERVGEGTKGQVSTRACKAFGQGRRGEVRARAREHSRR